MVVDVTVVSDVTYNDVVQDHVGVRRPYTLEQNKPISIKQ